MRLIVAGGGTGGHLFPGIAVAEEFLARDAANEVLFVGSERGIEARAIPRLGYRLELISAAGIRGKGSLAKLQGAFRMLYGYAQSRKILRQFKPDLVLGVGGYARTTKCQLLEKHRVAYLSGDEAYRVFGVRKLFKHYSNLARRYYFYSSRGTVANVP